MKRSFSFLLGLVTLCGAETLRQTVRVYDLANMPAATLDRALVVAGQVLKRAGVETTWQRGPSEAPEARVTDYTEPDSFRGKPRDERHFLMVAITAGLPDTVRPGLTGYALPYARQGAHAVVFYDRIEKLYFASAVGPSVGMLLGAAIAHELGHVLMRSEEHSPAGLMKARWGRKEFLLLSCDRLQFTPENKQLLASCSRHESAR